MIGNSSTVYFKSQKYVVPKRENPYDITEEEFARRKAMQLNSQSVAKISQRDN